MVRLAVRVILLPVIFEVIEIICSLCFKRLNPTKYIYSLLAPKTMRNLFGVALSSQLDLIYVVVGSTAIALIYLTSRLLLWYHDKLPLKYLESSLVHLLNRIAPDKHVQAESHYHAMVVNTFCIFVSAGINLGYYGRLSELPINLPRILLTMTIQLCIETTGLFIVLLIMLKELCGAEKEVNWRKSLTLPAGVLVTFCFCVLGFMAARVVELMVQLNR